MIFNVTLSPRARRELSRLDLDTARRVTAALQQFAAIGLGDVARLTGIRPPEYRLRVGDWRVIFHKDDQQREIVVLHILPRGKAYR